MAEEAVQSDGFLTEKIIVGTENDAFTKNVLLGARAPTARNALRITARKGHPLIRSMIPPHGNNVIVTRRRSANNVRYRQLFIIKRKTENE